MKGTFEKFTIADNFNSDQQSPGLPYAIHPDGKTNERAHVLVAGGYDNSVYLLTPNGDASKFEYEKSIIENTGGVVNGLDTYDIDGDGWLEMFVPNSTEGSIEILKMSAPASPTEFLQ